MMFEEFVQVFIIGLLIFLPVSLIYKKAGFHPAWAALVPWPNQRDKSARQDFSRKLKWGPSDFSGEKFSWRLLPSAARVRPAPAAVIGSEEAAASVCPQNRAYGSVHGSSHNTYSILKPI